MVRWVVNARTASKPSVQPGEQTCNAASADSVWLSTMPRAVDRACARTASISTVSRRSLEPRASEIMALYRSSGFMSMFCVDSGKRGQQMQIGVQRRREHEDSRPHLLNGLCVCHIATSETYRVSLLEQLARQSQTLRGADFEAILDGGKALGLLQGRPPQHVLVRVELLVENLDGGRVAINVQPHVSEQEGLGPIEGRRRVRMKMRSRKWIMWMQTPN